MNIVTKNGGKKSEKKIFTRIIRISRTKNDRKKSSGQKCEYTFFMKTRYRDQKMGGKNARKFFSKKTRILRVLNDGKKSSGKSVKTLFFINT